MSICRRAAPIRLPQVEYSLTALGRSLAEPALAFGERVRAHLAEFDAARRRFDERDGKAERLTRLCNCEIRFRSASRRATIAFWLST
jgi:hypothetical protein